MHCRVIMRVSQGYVIKVVILNNPTKNHRSVKMISYRTNFSSMLCAAPRPTHAATSADWLPLWKARLFHLPGPPWRMWRKLLETRPGCTNYSRLLNRELLLLLSLLWMMTCSFSGPVALWCVVKVCRTQKCFNWRYVRPHTSSSISKDASCWAKWLPFLMALYPLQSYIFRHRWFYPMQNVDFSTSIVHVLQKFFFSSRCENSPIIKGWGTTSFEIRNQPHLVQSLIFWCWGFDELGFLPQSESSVHRAGSRYRIKGISITAAPFDSSGGELLWCGIWSGSVDFCEI